MTDVEDVQPVLVTIDDEQYDMNEQSDAAKEHFVEIVNLRKQLAETNDQMATLQRQLINLQVVIGFRENALKESIQVVEEAEEVVN